MRDVDLYRISDSVFGPLNEGSMKVVWGDSLHDYLRQTPLLLSGDRMGWGEGEALQFLTPREFFE